MSDNNKAPLPTFFRWIRDRFFAGVFITLPIALTLWIVNLLYNLINQPSDHLIRLMIMQGWIPGSEYFQQHHSGTIPGAGFLLSILILLLLGILVGNFIGQKVLEWIDHLLNRLPVIHPIYSALKQAVEAVQNLGSDNGKMNFSQVVYVKYPAGNAKLIGFVMSRYVAPDGTHRCTVFLPTAPSPLTGFVLVIPENEIENADMSVEQATKAILSLGLVMHGDKREN